MLVERVFYTKPYIQTQAAFPSLSREIAIFCIYHYKLRIQHVLETPAERKNSK